MRYYNNAATAGQTLRQLRLQRGWTLKQMADSLGMSAPVLSRKERGAQPLERKDIRAIIAHCRLTPYEAYRLWLSAGLIPDNLEPPRSARLLRVYAEHLLPLMPFPACVITRLGYILGWNSEYEALFEVSQLPLAPLHLLDIVFAQEARANAPRSRAASVTIYSEQVLALCYREASRLMSDPRLEQLLQLLSHRYGAAFDARWRSLQAKSAGTLADSTPPTVVQQHTAGPVIYFALHDRLMLPEDGGLVILVPANQDSFTRFQQFCAGISGGCHFRQPPG